MIEKHWRHFIHDADIGVRGVGKSKDEAFEQAAIALTAVVTDPARVSPNEPVRIECQAPNDEVLLNDWLNALVYEMAIKKMLFSRFDLKLDDHSLRAKAWGEKVDVGKHEPAVEVKGATYTELKVDRNENGMWTAQCVVDV
jgi:SHS2 domain-containing protein